MAKRLTCWPMHENGRGFDPQNKWKLLIGGEWVEPSSTYEITDPNTTETVGHAPDASVAEAEAAAAAAKACLLYTSDAADE